MKKLIAVPVLLAMSLSALTGIGLAQDLAPVATSGVAEPSVATTSLAEETIRQELACQLLSPRTTWNELRAIVEADVPSLPPPRSIDDWETTAEMIRSEFLSQVIFRGEATKWRDVQPNVKWFETIYGGPGYRIRKFAYEGSPGMWIPALLYEPTELRGKVPVVLNVNGHHRGGKAMDYKQRRCINLARRGMLALNLEFLDMGQLHVGVKDKENRHNGLAQIDLCGTSGLAPFYLTLTRGLDVALAHEHADQSRVAVTGLSGGGWQTIMLAALDTRIILANPVAGYCSLLARTARFNNVGDAEQIPTDMCTVADYTHLTALVAPRPLLLTYNAEDDCCFLPPDVLPQLEAAARPIYELYDRQEHFRTHVNHDPGTHNFDADNREALYRLLAAEFFTSADNVSTMDFLIADDELKSADQLAVPLPRDNATLHSLAKELSRSLPEEADLPSDPQTVGNWQRSLRQKLWSVVRVEQFEVSAQDVDQSQFEQGMQVTHARLRLSEKWTVPVSQFEPQVARSTVITITDTGRVGATDLVQQHLASGSRVLAMDLLGFGEAHPHLTDGKDDQIALHLLATVGRRPLGVMVGQLSAVAAWTKNTHLNSDVKIVARGPRSCVIALVAAAVEAKAIQSVELCDSWPSLKELIWRNGQLEEAPELFCFGLLKVVDLPQLAALAAPRSVVVHDPSPELRWHWSGVQRWHERYGGEVKFVSSIEGDR